MIPWEILGSLVFPWMLIGHDGGIVDEGSGAFFTLPGRAKLPASIEHVRKLRVPGWTVCPSGYAVYARYFDEATQTLLVLPGLKVRGISKAHGSEPGLTIKMEPQDVADYVDNVFVTGQKISDRNNLLVLEHLHEIRGMNGKLYHAAYGAAQKIEAQMPGTLEHNLTKNVVALSEMLATRIDYIDFIADPTGFRTSAEYIPVYRKFDKINRCFIAAAFKERRARLKLTGNSKGEVVGPRVFEVIPYLMLDNALKYTPSDNEVIIDVHDNTDFIICSVASIGPQIDPDEVEKVFLPTYRGRHALETGRPGSGMGLPILKRLVENIFLGSIVLKVGRHLFDLDRIPYAEITFELTFSRAR